MKVKSKIESDYILGKLDLNRLTSKTFRGNEVGQIEDFLIDTNFDFYALRDKFASGGKFQWKVPRDMVLEEAIQYYLVGISETLYDHDKQDLLLQGEAQIERDGTARVCLNDIPGMSNRQAMDHPKYIFCYNEFEEKRPVKLLNIPGIKRLLDRIYELDLLGPVVEFSYYSVNVGMKKENYIFWEIRNY